MMTEAKKPQSILDARTIDDRDVMTEITDEDLASVSGGCAVCGCPNVFPQPYPGGGFPQPWPGGAYPQPFPGGGFQQPFPGGGFPQSFPGAGPQGFPGMGGHGTAPIAW
jgi:bacteriocin-like protein